MAMLFVDVFEVRAEATEHCLRRSFERKAERQKTTSAVESPREHVTMSQGDDLGCWPFTLDFVEDTIAWYQEP